MRLSNIIDFMKLRGKQKNTTMSNKAKYDLMRDVTDVFDGYNYYIDFLFEKLIKIFKWENLPNTVPQDALEDYILHIGYGGFTKNEKYGFLAVPPNKYGVGLYPRYEPFAQYCTPLVQGENLLIGKDIVIVKNNTYQLSCERLVQRYARLLADMDSTLDIAISNYRIQALPSFDNEESAESYKAVMVANRLGQVDTIVDKSFLSKGEFVPFNNIGATGKMLDLVQTRNEILRTFLFEIGITTASDKKERMVVDEVNANKQLLLFNISDMLKCRQKACEQINAIYGLNVKVGLSEEYEILNETTNVVEEKETTNVDENEESEVDKNEN